MAILRLLAWHRGQSFTSSDIARGLYEGRGGPIYGDPPEAWVIDGVLGELTEIGVLATNGDSWWVGGKDGDGIGGGGNGIGRLPPGNGGGGGDGGDDDDGRGGGLAEVLAHPVMFSSDEADFDRALTGALIS